MTVFLHGVSVHPDGSSHSPSRDSSPPGCPTLLSFVRISALGSLAAGDGQAVCPAHVTCHCCLPSVDQSCMEDLKSKQINNNRTS